MKNPYYDDFVCLTPTKGKKMVINENDKPKKKYKDNSLGKWGRINVRFTPDNRALIQRAARLQGFPSTTAFIREVMLDMAQKIVNQNDNIIAVTGDYMGENC